MPVGGNSGELKSIRLIKPEFQSITLNPFPVKKRTSEDGLSPTGSAYSYGVSEKKGSCYVDYNYVDILIIYTKISIFTAEPFMFNLLLGFLDMP